MMTSTRDDYRIMLSLLRLGTNTIKNGCRECCLRPGKAICLGEKQAFLLELLIRDDRDDELQWDIRNGEIHICEREILESSFKCGERPKNLPVLWNKDPENAEAGWNDEKLAEIERQELKPYLNKVEDWSKFCEPILLTLSINSCNKIVNRQTLVHLCMNSCYGAVLFRKMMIKTLSLLVANWFDDRKLQEIAAFFVRFLEDLSNYEYRDDLEQNVAAHRLCLCDRIRGTDIDPLYKIVQSRDKEQRKKEEDILEYFKNQELRNSAYYVDRIVLIRHILAKKGLKQEKKQLERLCRIGKGVGEIGTGTKKIYDIINAIDTCGVNNREAFAKQAGEMIDKCTRDWVDEYIEGVREQM